MLAAMQDVERLTETEALALAGLLRTLIRYDGQFSEGEREALAIIATSIALSDDPEPAAEPYRSNAGAAAPLGEASLYALIERAGEDLSDDAAVRAAALAITRPAARATIHALLFEVAASDVISKAESALLDWLAAAWELEAPRVLEDDGDA